LAFDRLFENRGGLRHQSVLDRVNECARSLSRTVSASDEDRLDEYLTSVREIETRIERMRAAGGLPEDVREHTRLMCDIIALAFQTDRTRVASLVLARDLSLLRYPFLDVRGGHHEASHDDLSDGYERIVRFHVSQLAYLAQQLVAMPEGDG